MLDQELTENGRSRFARIWADSTADLRWSFAPIDVRAEFEHDGATPLRIDRNVLWDAEVRKAHDPGRYLPGIVRDGSGVVWGRRFQDGRETFFRRSSQRMWRDPERFAPVLELVDLDHVSMTATFLGLHEAPSPTGSAIRAAALQPLFHVQHWVGGENERPLARWRLVHEPGSSPVAPPPVGNALPEFVAIRWAELLEID